MQDLHFGMWPCGSNRTFELWESSSRYVSLEPPRNPWVKSFWRPVMAEDEGLKTVLEDSHLEAALIQSKWEEECRAGAKAAAVTAAGLSTRNRGSRNLIPMSNPAASHLLSRSGPGMDYYPFSGSSSFDGGFQDNILDQARSWKQEDTLRRVRRGPERRNRATQVRGFSNQKNFLCYTNSVLTLLMNLSAFTGYLNRVHIADGEPPQDDLLTLLNELARAYWTTDAFPGYDIEYPAAVVRRYVQTISRAHRFGVDPFEPSGGSEAQEDAADYLSKILEICSAQVRHSGQGFGRNGHDRTAAANFAALIEPVFQKRQACAGTGITCANKKVRSRANVAGGGDLYSPIITVGVEADSATLANTIDKFMRYETELTCRTCKHLPASYTGRRLGRFWNTFVATPEILFFKINRYRYQDGRIRKMPWLLQIPEHLDLGEYVDQKAAGAAAVEARYRLIGVVSHSGDVGGGHYISFVKHHAYDDEWVCVDDDHTTPSTFAEAVRDPAVVHRHNNRSFFPYVLAYTKVHVHDDLGVRTPQSARSQRTR